MNSLYKEVIAPIQADATGLSVIHYFQQFNLLYTNLECPDCRTLMNLTKYSKSKDGYAWKCQDRLCSRNKYTISIKTNTFFDKSKINLKDWLLILYCFAQYMPVAKSAELTAISSKTIGQIYQALRKMMTNHFDRHPVKLGGPGRIVQIDESCFSHKRKYQRGRAPEKEIWVFGLVDTSYNPAKPFVKVVEKRRENTATHNQSSCDVRFNDTFWPMGCVSKNSTGFGLWAQNCEPQEVLRGPGRNPHSKHWELVAQSQETHHGDGWFASRSSAWLPFGVYVAWNVQKFRVSWTFEFNSCWISFDLIHFHA